MKDLKLKEYDAKKTKAKALNHTAMGAASIGAGLGAIAPVELPEQVEQTIFVLVSLLVNYGLRYLTDWLKHKS